jgi:hypothetical protein
MKELERLQQSRVNEPKVGHERSSPWSRIER